MFLTKEQLIENVKIFRGMNQKYSIFTEELINFLGDKFFKSPASTGDNLYNAFEGGLLDHLIRVSKYIIKLNDLLPSDLQEEKTSLIKISFLHQIAKSFLFEIETSKWHRDNGKKYKYTQQDVSMRVSERSAFYAMKYGVVLTEKEYAALVHFDKDDTDEMVKYYNSTMGKLLKLASNMAIIEEQKIKI